jgi:uncharacterized protein
MKLRTVVALAAGAAAYSFLEPYRFRLTERAVPVESARGEPAELSILHLSDTHLGPGRTATARFLAALPERLATPPDLVIATGDLIQNDAGIEPLVEAFAQLEGRLGRFYVLGSHDYFLSSFQNYAKYFTGRRELIRARRLDSERLEEGLRAKGWVSLSNDSATVTAGGGRVRLAGIDDPYLHRHRTGHIARRDGDALAIGVTHTPDVVSEWLLNGFDIVLAGHTHGGQVRIPGVGALVTNSKLPAALAAGLHRIGSGWLHVSPGLGHGRFAPIRFNCPPEATLLRLTSGSSSPGRLRGAKRR